MAIVNNGTKNSLPDTSIPTGYTRPTITEIADFTYVSDLVLDVAKAGAENNNRVTTMTNIIDVASIGITAQVDAILAKDYLGTAVVTAYSDWISITNNFVSLRGDGEVLSDDAAKYICTVKLYIKVV